MLSSKNKNDNKFHFIVLKESIVKFYVKNEG
jgi:hypothetical protein